MAERRTFFADGGGVKDVAGNGSFVGALTVAVQSTEDAREIDEMLSGVSTAAFESLHDLESLVLDDNQPLFGQEVLSSELLGSAEQVVQLDHCYSQSPSSDPSPLAEKLRAKHKPKRSIPEQEDLRAPRNPPPKKSRPSPKPISVTKDEVKDVTTTLENALTPQELDVVNAAVARISSSELLPELDDEAPKELFSPKPVESIETSSARPSRKSKEKFQRNLERKRQLGKNIEDYVSDDSGEELCPPKRKPPTPQKAKDSQPRPGRTSTPQKSRKFDQDPEPESSEESEQDDEDWNSDNDPEKLWCVCHKPHNNQFMIACDACENWFHGKCVGVTKAEGAKMEKAGQEWYCTNCKRKRNGVQATEIRPPNLSVPLIDSMAPNMPPLMLGNYTVLGQCAQCKQRIDTDPTHRFCNRECSTRHVNRFLPTIMERAERENLEVRVSMVEISTGKAINLVNASVHGTIEWLCRKPTFQINPNQASALRRPVPKQNGAGDERDNHKSTNGESKNGEKSQRRPSASRRRSSTEKPTQSSQAADDVRQTATNTLARIIRERCEGEKNFKLEAGNSDELAKSIEKSLWTQCDGISKNYKSKFRSLSFNMKDPKNELWRRVVRGEIEPKKLVRMGADELSTEMARWREREAQHNLDLYKKEAAINVTDQDTLSLLADGVKPREGREKSRESSRRRAITNDGKDAKSSKDKESRRSTQTIRKSPDKRMDQRDLRSLDRAQKIIDQVKAIERKNSSLELISFEENESKDKKEVNVSATNDVATWNGVIRMEAYKFVGSLRHVAGPDNDFEIGLPDTLVICGKIQPQSVKEYLARLKHSNKDFVVVRIEAEPSLPQNAVELKDICKRLKGRDRYGVVEAMRQTRVKDFYMLPLDAGESAPDWFPDVKSIPITSNACLLGLAICHNKSAPRRDLRSAVHYEPTPVKNQNRVADISASIEEAGRGFERQPHLGEIPPFLSAENSLSVLSSIAAQQGNDDEAYDPDAEWA